MEAERLDQVSDTLGFLLARIRCDEEAAIAIIQAEAGIGPNLLMGMTDLAMAMAMTIAVMVGTDAETIVTKMALGAKFMGPEFGRRG